MQEQEILGLLTLLGEELQSSGIKRPIQVLLIGGGYMVTQIHNRRETGDVDVVTRARDLASERRQFLQRAVGIVAARTGASPKWLSESISDRLHEVLTIPDGVLWFSHGKLQVFVPPADYILALKLLPGREKDRKDIEALKRLLRIKTRRQASRLLEKYFDAATLIDLSERLQTHLDAFF